MTKEQQITDEDFIASISGVKGRLDMSDQKLAHEIGVNAQAIDLWIRGENLPLPATRKSIFTWATETKSPSR